MFTSKLFIGIYTKNKDKFNSNEFVAEQLLKTTRKIKGLEKTAS